MDKQKIKDGIMSDKFASVVALFFMVGIFISSINPVASLVLLVLALIILLPRGIIWVINRPKDDNDDLTSVPQW